MEPGQGSVRPTVMSMLTQFARAGLLVSLMSSLALASCGDGTAGTKGGEVLRSGAAYVLTGAAGAGDNIAGIGIGGTVRMVGDCLGIGDAVVIWPYGTKVVADSPLAIEVPDLGRLGVGDVVEGGGEDLGADQLPEGFDVPSRCRSENFFAFYPNHQ